MNSFETAYKIICELVNDFKANEVFYVSEKYNEHQARKDFIDKFFIALGWDVNHSEQKNPYKQEVKVEETQINQRRPDYTFYIEPKFKEPKFFVEAKKPARNLKDPLYIYQTIRYARFASTPVAVLTDFEEFHILDCRYKPDVKSVLQNPNHKYFHYTDYLNKDKFAEIFYLFSREAVEKNSLEEYAESLPKIKVRGVQTAAFKLEQQTIDEEFLIYLDDVRENLAKAFKKNNITLSSDELTEATQRTIDRLVFIRFLEDKLIEDDDYITKLGLSKNAWGEFVALCKKLNAKYNGIVFKEHFIDRQEFKGPELSEFTSICLDFSQTNQKGFNYNLIPIHILGSIYERFLGKIVVATDKRVRIEEKPEVRKAGGVYYTPKYIVDYIVQNTVGKLIEDKTPKEISKLRFADIACGSGSFLIGVFETLLEYYKNYYWNNHEEAKKDGCIFKDNIPYLSIKQKQEILLNNIYGVDIDHQAVEVTQLSLALKMLEDETLVTANEMQALFHEQILPNLTKNIVCGNSLIGTDILDGKIFPTEEERKLNPMDFDKRFPEIMKSGGFDAIVGNPPYVRQEQLSDIKDYLTEHFEVFIGMADLYSYFIEKGIKLLNQDGYFGYIVANKWIRANYGKNLREFLLKHDFIEIIDFGDLPVFKTATTYPCILLVRKTNQESKDSIIYTGIKTLEFHSLDDYIVSNNQSISRKFLNSEIWNLIPDNENMLIEKIKKAGIPLGEYVNKKVYYGIKTGLNEAFVIDGKTRNELIANDKRSEEVIKPFLTGKDIKRYSPLPAENYLIFFPKGFTNKNGNSPKDAWKWLNDNYPALAGHLKPFEKKGKQRYDKGEYWWELRACDYYSEFEKPKILWGNLCNQPSFSIDYFNSYVNAPSVIIPLDDLYLLGIMNSKLSWYILKLNAAERQGGFIEAKPIYVSMLPIKKIDIHNVIESSSYNKIVSLVKDTLNAKKQFIDARTEKDKSYYERKCADLDNAIDAEVYKLYGLTEEEIKIVEGKG